MHKWTLLDAGPVPGSGGALSLHQSREQFVIRVDGQELMSSRSHASEDALAELACAPLGERARARLLIGGLGMGFTLAAALGHVGPDADVVVVELVPAVVRWNRGPLAHLAGHPLDDARATVLEGDVGAVIRQATGAWDAILLDVDNGPDGLTRDGNGWLYSPTGLRAAHRALRPRGVLAVWSAAPDPVFTRRLRRARFDVEAVPVRAHGRRHLVWVARRR